MTASRTTVRVPRTTAHTARRRASEWMGRVAEVFAALCLLLRGYRILSWRNRTPYGEIDLIAVRGRRLAFVEVKQRASAGDAEWAVRAQQTIRLRNAAAYWVAKRPYYEDFEQGLDLMLVVPWQWPELRSNALQAVALVQR